MNTLFNTQAHQEILSRIDKLNPQTIRLWGKMEVAQMMAHCTLAFKNALSTEKKPRMFMGYIVGSLIKSQLYNDKPWKPSSITAPEFVQKEPKNFEEEKKNLIDIVNRFHQGGEAGVTKYPHSFFGKITPEQWGQSQYKHIDHHLKQFGV